MQVVYEKIVILNEYQSLLDSRVSATSPCVMNIWTVVYSLQQ